MYSADAVFRPQLEYDTVFLQHRFYVKQINLVIAISCECHSFLKFLERLDMFRICDIRVAQ